MSGKLKAAGMGMPTKAFKPFKPPQYGTTAPPTNSKSFLPKDLANTGADPRKKLQKSQTVGLETSFDQQTDGIKYKPASMAKVSFQMSMYSGPLSEGAFIARSARGMPSNPGGIKVSGPPSQLGSKEDPDTDVPVARAADSAEKRASLAECAAFAIEAIGYWEAKQAAVTSPKAQLSSSQSNKAAPKITSHSGPSIAQIAKPKGFGTPLAGATKTAALKELVRLGLRDIPGTPRLVMKSRTPVQRAAVAQGVEKAWDQRITEPLKAVAGKAGFDRLPEGKFKNVAGKVINAVAEDPVGMTATTLLPVPGSEALYLGAKKGLGRLIDKIDPVPVAKAVG